MADLVLGAALGTAFTLLYDAVDEATVGQFKKFKPLQCYSYHCNDFNATPTTATTQLVPSSNTLTASVGFSNGANFVSSPASSVGFIANNNGDVISQQGPSQNKFGSTVQQNTGYSQYNNGRSNAGNFNGSNEYSENNNGGYSKLQPKAAGVQRIESDDLRQLHTHTMKVTKSELIAPEMLLKSVQKSSKHVVVAASDNKRSENSNDTGSVDLLISKLNSIALSPNFENASKEGDSAVNQSKASLESYVDQEKKILEYGSVKDKSVSAKVSDDFNSTIESQDQAAFLTSKPVPVSIAIPTSSRSNDVTPFLIQGTRQFPCTSSERLLLNCRQASPMVLWQLPRIPPG